MPGLGGGGGSAVTVWEVVGDVVAGAVLAGTLVEVVLVGGLPLEVVGGAVGFGSVVLPVVVGACGPGGEVARGGGQGGSRELAASSRNWRMAFSRDPVGSPA
jgi:hypothetical protein